SPDIVLAYHQDISQRIKTEIKLLESNQKFEALFKQSPICIAIFSIEGYLEDINPAIEKLIGYRKNEVVGKHFTEIDLYPPEVLSLIQKRQKELKSKNLLNTIEIQLKRKNGEFIWVISQVSKIKIHESEYFQVILQDVNDLRKIEKQLSKKEEDYKNIIENLSDLVIQIDYRGIIEYISPQIKKVMGYQNDDLLGKSIFSLIHPEDIDKFLIGKQETEHTGKPLEIEYRMKKKDGGFLYVSIKGRLINMEGKLGLLGIIRDISPRKNAELQIKRRLKIEKLIAKISSRFAGIIDFNEAIYGSLKAMGTFINAKRAYLFLFDQNKDFMSNTNEWVAPGIEPQIIQLQQIPLKKLSFWIKQLKEDDYIRVLNSENLLQPESPNTYVIDKYFHQKNIYSILVYPIRIKGELSGFLGFDDVLTTRNWERDDFKIFKIPSEIIGNVLERKYAEETLKGSQEMLKNVLASINNYIIIINKDFEIIWINNLAKTLFSENIIGKKCYKAYRNNEVRCKDCVAIKTFNDNKKYDLTFEFLSSKGKNRYFHCISNAIAHDSLREPELVALIADDVTKLKRLEEKLQKH
ncbi:MAG: PAS domain S-box protein, partial [Candidatus Lokiarchaeota archaeon]